MRFVFVESIMTIAGLTCITFGEGADCVDDDTFCLISLSPFRVMVS